MYQLLFSSSNRRQHTTRAHFELASTNPLPPVPSRPWHLPCLQSVKFDDLCTNFQEHEALDSAAPVVTATLAADGSIMGMALDASGDAGLIPVTVPTASVDNVRFFLILCVCTVRILCVCCVFRGRALFLFCFYIHFWFGLRCVLFCFVLFGNNS